MYETKMRVLPPHVGCERKSEAPTHRLHMPPLPQPATLRKVNKALAYLALSLIDWTTSLGCAWIASLIFRPLAYQERGYNAIGGELFLIIGAGALSYYLINSWRRDSNDK